jgi:large subunit ribosomal protein L18
MFNRVSKNQVRTLVHRRIRRKVQGTPERPRLAVFRSVAHIYAQIIDDSKGVTLAAASSLEKAFREELKTGANIEAAKRIGKEIAERAKKAGVDKVVFDRGGYMYHGRVKALAEGAREGGLEF